MKFDVTTFTLPRKKLFCLLTVAGLVICLAGGGLLWSRHIRAKAPAEDVILVRTAVVGSSSAAQGYTYAGEVRGRFESQLAFQVGGKIIKRNVQLGSTVQGGEILMEIDSRDLQQTVNSNSAQVASVESQLKLAESNLSRYRQLLGSGAISQAQYDQYVSSYEVAVASLRQASAQHSQGANQLEYSQLRADKAGVVSSLAAEVGQVVSAGQVVVTVVQDGDREVEISVPENRVEELRQGGSIQVTFWALPNLAVSGTVREIAPMADQTTRTFKVRISLLNPPPEIKLGMTAAVTVASGNPQLTASIPLSAVYQDGNTPKVWIVQDNTVVLRPITTGSLGNGTILVTGGLQSGERIVTAGVHRLKEGQKVKTGGDS
ncbi:MAG TPA: efflux RND transporter periplasmic adaptor subunit [Patescibacteria group bacterium]|nr:efflux RND transporter periplasmic adaptor subunit [Patescibacteria group bacterium]